MPSVELTEGRSHYQTLRVRSNASRTEIHSAFRRLVKIYHPDKNPHRIEWAEAKMRELIQAYRVVSDDTQRLLYDRLLGRRGEFQSFAERMAARHDDLAAQAKLVLHYLLEGEFDDAIDLHEQLMLRRATFCMGDHLDDRDYLDSLFLLGEAYEGRRQWHTAARFYWEAYEREKSGPKKRYFFEELRDRLRVLFSQRLIQGLSPEDALKHYRRALPLCIANRDAALIYKKMAALHTRLGQRLDAIEALDKARRLCPGMKAIEVMRKKIAGT